MRTPTYYIYIYIKPTKYHGGANTLNPKNRTGQGWVGYTRPPLPFPWPLPLEWSEVRLLQGEKAEIMASTAIVFTSFLLTGITLAASFFTLRSAVELEISPLEFIFLLAYLFVSMCVFCTFVLVFVWCFCNWEGMQNVGWFI